MVAVVLLMAVTVAAAGTFYTVMMDTQQDIQDNTPDLTLDTENLNVESCWTDGGDVAFNIRNEDPQNSINNSEIDVIVAGEELDYTLSPEGLVGPQETFELRFDSLSSTDQVVEEEAMIFLGESEMTYTCYT